jgi:hypothetical protein
MTTLRTSLALEDRDPMADRLKPGEELATEVFEGMAKWLTEDELATEAGGQKKKGRLGRLVFEFKTADTINGNRRIYPAEVFKLALAGLQERIGKNVVFGNLDHPSIWDPESLQIRLSDAAVKVVEAKMTSDTDVKVICDILDNEHGRQLVSVLEANGNPGVSQRAVAKWREPTEAERERHKIPAEEYVRVAEVLRLITYDVVSEPGFLDADGAQVTEHRTGDSPMNKDELKAKYPHLYAEVVAEGRTAAEAEFDQRIESAIEERKPAIVEEAVKPVQDKLDEAEGVIAKFTQTLEGMKPVMVERGIVNEQITDADAAAKVATAEAKVATLETEKAALEEQNATLKKSADALEAQSKQRAALKAVSEQYAQHAQHDAIVTQVAAKGLTDTAKALEAAKAIADFIASLGIETKAPANDKPKETADPMPGVLDGLLHGNTAPANNGTGNRGTQPADEISQSIGQLLANGVPTIF